MPWSRMRRPVARWVRNELSNNGRRPVTRPQTTTAAPTTPRSDGRGTRTVARRGVSSTSVSSACTLSACTLSASMASARSLAPTGTAEPATCSGTGLDVDDRGPDDDDEERGEDAEHHGNEHLHRCLLRLLLRELTALDAHLVGLGAEHAPDRDTEGVGLEDGEHERAHLGYVG